MATTYYPSPRHRDSWILANGEVIQEPELEETDRKYRVVGTNLTAYKKSIDQLLFDGVTALASQHGTIPWRRISGSWDCPPTPPLHLLNSKTSYWDTTEFEWRFKHESLPINAKIAVSIRQETRNLPSPQSVGVRLKYSSSNIADSRATNLLEEYTPGFHAQLQKLSQETRDLWTQFFQAHTDGNAPETNWQSVLKPRSTFQVTRMAVKAMIEAIREVDAIEAIYLPDLRQTPDLNDRRQGWLRLEAFETNMTPQAFATLREYLETAPTIEEAAQHYEQMLKALRRAGMVLEGRSTNDFLTALLTGDKDALTIPIGTGILPSEDPEVAGPLSDIGHTLSLHLPTGTFSVTCGHRSRNEIAAKWDESLTMASLTGKEDELLAYARRYVEQQSEGRTKFLNDLTAL